MTRIALPRIEPVTGIPRRIYQTFPTHHLPSQLSESVQDLRARNPEYQYKLFDDAEIIAFIDQFYDPEILRIFQTINPEYGAARADLFRYLLMYKMGGIYLDIKSNAKVAFKHLLRADDSFLISQWDNGPCGNFPGWGVHDELSDIPGGEIQQWQIIAAPGHPFLRAVIETVLRKLQSYRPWRDGVGRPGTLRATGPVVYTKTIYPLLNTYPYRRVDAQKDLGLKYSIMGTNNTLHTSLFRKTYHLNTNSLVIPRGSPNAIRSKLWNARLRYEQSHRVYWFRFYRDKLLDRLLARR